MSIRSYALTSNKAYTTYFPYTVYAIAAFYSLVYVLQFLFKVCRQIRRHIQQAEKESLRHAWIDCVVQNRYPFTLDHSYCLMSPLSSFIYHPFHLSRQKRLNLLWDWGLSMGYCEYSHAAYLNQLVRDLENHVKEQ